MWYFGPVLPAANACLTSTSMAPPFSAWTQIRPPFFAVYWNALNNDASSSIKAPG